MLVGKFVQAVVQLVVLFGKLAVLIVLCSNRYLTSCASAAFIGRPSFLTEEEPSQRVYLGAT